MDKDIKEKWVKALRSGRYKQGQHVLFDPQTETYCCLGVLCRTTRVATKQQIQGRSFLTEDWLKKLGLDPNEIAKPTNQSAIWPLAFMNDEGKSFTEIADFIEANL